MKGKLKIKAVDRVSGRVSGHFEANADLWIERDTDRFKSNCFV